MTQASQGLSSAHPHQDLRARRAWSMVESAPDAMLLADADGVIVEVNRQAERMFGQHRSELIGRVVETLIPDRFADRHRAHRAEYARAPGIRAMGEGRDLFARRHDGSEFAVDVSLSPLDDTDGEMVVATVRDITQRVETDRRLARSESLFRTSFERAPVGMAIGRIEPDGSWILEQANDSLASMLARPGDDIVGRDLVALSHPDDRRRTVDAAHEMAADRRDSFVTEQRLLRPDDGVLWVLAHTSVIERGHSTTTLTHLVDVSDRRERHLERQRIATMEDRERIARDIHDLVIQRLFAAGMQLQAVIPEMGSDTARTRSHATINELDATIRELRSAIFSLHQRSAGEPLVAELQATIDQWVDRLGFRPRLRINGSLDAVAESTAAELRATLREALSNVVRHASATRVDVTIDASGADLVLRVQDNGVGIDAGRGQGNGLDNLAERAERLGGLFEVGTIEEGGTRLVWTVPR